MSLMKNYDQFVFPYILGAIETEGYEVEATTDKEKLQFVVDTFEKEYGWPDNKRLYPNIQDRFAQWLMGLPTVISIDFEYYRMIELAKEWGSLPPDATEKQEDKITDNWFPFISSKFFKLCRKHKVNY